ncbi:MAG: hypothetical protein VYD64_11585, partial [Pseudomonadota bacterium]|nr:hypothetical protein [Pseudomonadota bacterium]
VLKFMSRRFRVTKTLRGDRFFVREPDAQTGEMKLFITPLLLALCVVEIADLIFAVDSIPAIFAITTDPFIVFTSNIFAIMGLRSLFFALSALLHRFSYLKYALSLVLVFIGAKIIVAPLLGFEKVPPVLSLGVTLGLLGTGIIASLIKTSGKPAPEAPQAVAEAGSGHAKAPPHSAAVQMQASQPGTGKSVS